MTRPKQKLSSLLALHDRRQRSKYFATLGDIIHKEAIETLRKQDSEKRRGADDIFPLCITSLENRYDFESATFQTLSQLLGYLERIKYVPISPKSSASGLDNHRFVTAVSAFKIAAEEQLMQLKLEKLKDSVESYQSHLNEQLKKDPSDQVVTNKLNITQEAREFLYSDQIASNDQKIEAFYEHIENNKEALKKNSDSQTKIFFKTIAVIFAGVLGLGVGGIYAYKSFFNESIHSHKFQTQLQDSKSDLSIEPEPSNKNFKK